MWSTLLSADAMINITNCNEEFQGDIIDWDKSKWILGEDTEKVKIFCADT